MTIIDGSSTIFKGLSSAITEKHEIVLSFPLKKGETVYKGQVLALDQDSNQETSPTAGFGETGDSNGYVLTPSDETAALVGVCLVNMDDSDTADPAYGSRVVPILLKGITLMRCIVNATGTADGYELPIKVGSPAMAGGTNDTVSGFTSLTGGAYAIAEGSTDGSSNEHIG